MTNNKYFIIFTAVLLPIAVAFLSPFLNLFTKEKKIIEYEINNVYSIESNDSVINNIPNVLITYKNGDTYKTITSGGIVTVNIKNSGGMPVSKTDYEKQLAITVDDKSTILAYKVINKEPDDLEINGTNNGKELSINNILLNSGESYTLELFVSGKSESVDVHSRLVGGNLAKVETVKINGLFVGFFNNKSNNPNKFVNLFTILPIPSFILGVLFLYLSFLNMDNISIDFFLCRENIMPICTGLILELISALLILPLTFQIGESYNLGEWATIIIGASIFIIISLVINSFTSKKT